MRRSLVPLAVLALGLAACADTTPEPEVSAARTDDDGAESEQVEPEPAPADEDDGPSTGDDPADTEDGDIESSGDEDSPADSDSSSEEEGEAPTPDAAAVGQPCADHEAREGEAFLELVSPVDDQQVGDEFELVGCASVYEGTVRYRLLDGDGETLLDEFTTAECGGPCIGEFRETVSLEAAEGEPVVHAQVFWDDASDGSERDLVERVVVR